MQDAQNKLKTILTTFITKTIRSLLISTGLFIGGIILLALRIPGWSIIFGLPAVQIGIIFLIFTFDDLARNKVGPNSYHLLNCSVCGKPILAPSWQKERICGACQKKIAKKPKEENS